MGGTFLNDRLYVVLKALNITDMDLGAPSLRRASFMCRHLCYDHVFRFSAGAGICLSSPPRPDQLWPTQPPVKWVPGSFPR